MYIEQNNLSMLPIYFKNNSFGNIEEENCMCLFTPNLKIL